MNHRTYMYLPASVHPNTKKPCHKVAGHFYECTGEKGEGEALEGTILWVCRKCDKRN